MTDGNLTVAITQLVCRWCTVGLIAGRNYEVVLLVADRDVDPALVDLALVDLALVDPALVDPALVHWDHPFDYRYQYRYY